MKRIIVIFILLLIGGSMVAGCSSDSQNGVTPPAEGAYSYRDTSPGAIFLGGSKGPA